MRTARVAQILVILDELSQEELEDLKTEVIELYKEREYSKDQNKEK
ncbi:MAG: hypothetical protein H0U27_07240 [Nitrosopumilus sp.]|nr:hypothetical protein [Nitrosopumilus sp.]